VRYVEAPALVCLHPCEKFDIDIKNDSGLTSLFFSPFIVNAVYTLSNVPAGET
jgi:hypothetical protein